MNWMSKAFRQLLFGGLSFFLLVVLFGCSNGGSGNASLGLLFGNGDDPFAGAASPGDLVAVTVGAVSVNFIYANNQAGITFPFSPNAATISNSGTATLTKKFFLAETEVTNALCRDVLQWAYNNGKIVESVGAHNEVSAATVKYGGKELFDLDAGALMKISYNTGTHAFAVASGYEDHPVVFVSWYGAVIFCNWMTEMRDGNTDNVVYSGIDDTWDHAETVEDAGRSGYRLPSNEEWEFAAKFIGTTPPVSGDLATQYIAKSQNGGSAGLTDGYCWTPGGYASGAIMSYGDAVATAVVAWFNQSEVQAVSGKIANQLGIHDMSGNVDEWCFTRSTSDVTCRVERGGAWSYGSAIAMGSGEWFIDYPQFSYDYLGFRISRSK